MEFNYMEFGIETNSLTKKFRNLVAVDNIDLKIPRGKIFGFLGPNGAGKSTTLKILSTILPPSSGNASIMGFDLKSDRKKIRELIGICPQEIVLYDRLTAKENIKLIAQMHNLHPSEYKEYTDELLGQMNLLNRGDEQVRKFSGGMKRRVNILMAVIHKPEVIFFDEPSAGLDPQSRRVVWDFIRDFEKENKTILLTTHNMEEADDLSDELAIIDHGKIIAQGTPNSLKGNVGKGDIIEFKLPHEKLSSREEIVSKLKNLHQINWVKELGKERISFNVLDGLRNISQYYDFLTTECSTKMHDIVIRQNTLEDVFIALTGHELREN